jgi:hypothetical protein
MVIPPPTMSTIHSTAVKVGLSLELSNAAMDGDVTDFRHGLLETDLLRRGVPRLV